MMFHPKHVLIKDEFQKHRMDHQSDILLVLLRSFGIIIIIIISIISIIIIIIIIIITIIKGRVMFSNVLSEVE